MNFKRIKNGIRRLFSEPKDIFMYCFRTTIGRFIPDKQYLCIIYRLKMHRRLNLKNPKTFNEKLQWLKLYDRKSIYTTMVDKYEVKKYVANMIGKEYIIPTIDVWNSFEEIEFDNLPNQFVLKCTHDSGGLVICRDKETMDKKAIKEKLESSLKRNYFWSGREWPYKNVKPRIIAEPYMEDAECKELRDFKLMCFDGTLKFSLVCSEPFSGRALKITFFDRNWNVMPFEYHYSKSNSKIEKTKTYEKIIELAEKLLKDIPFVQIDFYEVEEEVYFGEMTFYPVSGLEEFSPSEWDMTLGNWINLQSENGWILRADNISILIHTEKKIKSLKDYKFYCFNGEPRFLYVSEGLENRSTAKLSFLNMDWTLASFGRSDYHSFSRLPDKPSNFSKMIELAKELSKGISFLRVDFYEVMGRVYFGELTFYPCSGFMPFEPLEWDSILGEQVKI